MMFFFPPDAKAQICKLGFAAPGPCQVAFFLCLEYQLSNQAVLRQSWGRAEHTPFRRLQLIMSAEATSGAGCFPEPHQGPSEELSGCFSP